MSLGRCSENGSVVAVASDADAASGGFASDHRHHHLQTTFFVFLLFQAASEQSQEHLAKFLVEFLNNLNFYVGSYSF